MPATCTWRSPSHPIGKLLLTAGLSSPWAVLEDGWTQPLVIRGDNAIVDGFHRWWLVVNDKKVKALTGGLIPVVTLGGMERGHQIMSTIRHNRARGSHIVLKMASIVQGLIDEEKLSVPEIEKLLGMEKEEVDRLYDRGGMIERGSGDSFAKGWVPDTEGDRDKPTEK